MNSYRIPAGVELAAEKPPELTTSQGGRVVIDKFLLGIWRQADGRTPQEVIDGFLPRWRPACVAAALACLEQAGLLERSAPLRVPQTAASQAESPAGLAEQLGAAVGQAPPRVSVIMVSYNSLSWLPGCLRSVTGQTLQPFEVIVVDNASADGSANWLVENFPPEDAPSPHPQVRLVRLSQSVSLARALNLGVAAATGDYLLLLNPDVEMETDALARMVAIACQDAACAAVAAMLRFLWAPAFLNGLGNYVGALSWGTDSALGHLDLGQFDDWEEIPSACFAAALIPAAVFDQVGPIDEAFPLYYEDSEWCYRARLFGYRIRAAPRAIIYHAFSGRVPGRAPADQGGIASTKLRRVVYGRLRFISKLLGWRYLLRFLLGYLAEDLVRFSLAAIAALSRWNWETCQAYLAAWRDYLASIPSAERRDVQRRRRCTDRELFASQSKVPVPLVWRGLPCLTWDLVCHHYLPLLCAKPLATGLAPLMEGLQDSLLSGAPLPNDSIFRRAILIWQSEGFGRLVFRLGRWLQWRLARVS